MKSPPAQPGYEGRGQEEDRLSAVIPCLNLKGIPFTLVSTSGFHCEVWQSIGSIVSSRGRVDLDFVLKRYLRPCTFTSIKVLNREHQTLREALDTIVPRTIYIATEIDGSNNVIALCHTCTPWFDLANPGNGDEAIPLLERHRHAVADLAQFTAAARTWYERDDKLIDLFGRENLILDRQYRVRYIDSFHVFLYVDVMHTLPEVDPELQRRINISLDRLEYLERVVAHFERP